MYIKYLLSSKAIKIYKEYISLSTIKHCEQLLDSIKNIVSKAKAI